MDLQHRIRLTMLVAAALALAIGGCARPQATVEPGEAGETVSPEATPSEGGLSRVASDTFIQVSIGEPESLDPAWSYETTGSAIESNIYDSLITFEREKPDSFVPALATEWQISDDRLTYTFTIRQGVQFHEGGTLEPHDIAYAIQRALLQDRVDGPMWLFLEPMLGVSAIESLALEKAGLSAAAAEGQEPPTLADVPADIQREVCETVKAMVSADDEAGTVRIQLRQPTPWFLQLLAQPWAAALDQEWMIEQGDWDGTCENWTRWHDPAAEDSVLYDRANGTGPYRLGTWLKGQEITLEANDAYWRTEPIWEGGPSGPPRLRHIVFQKAAEWGTRFAKLSAGEADTVVVPRSEIGQLEPLVHTEYLGGDESAPANLVHEDGILKLFRGYPLVTNTAAMFTFAINADSEFIGSGKLDGSGIPVDFFSDVQVRRGMSYCFDWETYIAEALQGEAIPARGPIIQGLQGYREDSPVYALDIDKCRDELAQAWDGKVAEVGFRFTIAYNEGNDTRKKAAEILAENLALADSRYKVDVVSLEWPSFLDARRGMRLPISISGWQEDYHDASNWVHPYMHSQGAYARAQGFPPEMAAQFDSLIDAALLEADEARRTEMYAQLQELAIENAIAIFLHQDTGRFYVNRSVSGYYNNPLAPGLWYYVLSKP